MLLVGGAGLLTSTKYDDFGIFLCLNTKFMVRQSANPGNLFESWNINRSIHSILGCPRKLANG